MQEGARRTAASAPRRRRRWRSALSRTALVLLGTLAALLVCETGLRFGRLASPRLRALLYLPTRHSDFDRFDSTEELLRAGYFGYHPFGATRGFTLSSKGFRTSEYSQRKAPGTFRVIVLGDSFTFDSSSVPYAWMWHQQAGRLLADATGRRVEVLSLSAPAVGPRFLLRLWELEGRHLDPDLVVLGFFVGNDFSDEAGTSLEPAETAALARWSFTWRLLRNVARLQGVAATSTQDAVADRPAATNGAAVGSEPRVGGFESPDYVEHYDDDTPTLSEEQYLRIERQRLRFLAGPDADRFRALCDDAARIVERLGRDVEARGGRFVVLMIPDEAQVDAGLRRRLLPPAEAAALDVDRPQRCLAAALDALDVPYLDLLSAFRRAAPRRLYHPQDTHWNAAGNHLAGHTLAAYLSRHDLGPGSG